MRDLHARMLTALLEGKGLRGSRSLRPRRPGRRVAIVLPARGLAAAIPMEAEATRRLRES